MIDKLRSISCAYCWPRRMGIVVTFELQMKDLEGDSERLAGQRELVDSISTEMKSKDVELTRIKRENNKLLNSEGVLNQEVARYKFQADKKEKVPTAWPLV
eukprot:TRINITY_DN2481_c1_g1_i1.p1 TRINITY_DN2481_c1_g1~~TRINITY_DN2481_c1_g1_i1.p1  ORF type:complete len:101 (-),score=31.57 TRINITY_DN2481_c1_g1_i1:10-312(-)